MRRPKEVRIVSMPARSSRRECGLSWVPQGAGWRLNWKAKVSTAYAW